MFSDREAGIYLAAAIDGEGWVYFADKSAGKSRVAGITNSNEAFLKFCSDLCTQLGIGHRIERKKETENRLGKKPTFDLVISNEEGLRILQLMAPIQIDYKRDALKNAVDTYRPHFPLERAVELYNEGKSTRDISAILGIPQSTVQLNLAGHVNPRSGPGSRKTIVDIDEEKVRRLYADGVSVSEIARQCGVAGPTLRYRMKQMDLPSRPVGRPEGTQWSPEERAAREAAAAAKSEWDEERFNITKEELEQLYVEDRYSLAKISLLKRVSVGFLSKKMDEYGIPRRKPGGEKGRGRPKK